jgi:hypothetical protein
VDGNRFKLNVDKTHLLTVSTAERLSIIEQLRVSMNEVILEENPDNVNYCLVLKLILT